MKLAHIYQIKSIIIIQVRISIIAFVLLAINTKLWAININYDNTFANIDSLYNISQITFNTRALYKFYALFEPD